MARSSSPQPESESSAPPPPLDVEFLAEVLVDRELPPPSRIDLTVIDLTTPVDDPIAGAEVATEPGIGTDDTPASADAEPANTGTGWGLSDDTPVGRFITPDQVLAARSAYRKVAAGQPLVRSVGTVYLTASGFANDYVTRHLLTLTEESPVAGSITVVDGGALARAKLIRDGQHRLEYFLNLADDDFLACFRFNGDITGEYLLQVERCERERAAADAEAIEKTPEPSPKQRRQRKSRALRST